MKSKELITMREIAKIIGVPQSGVKEHFEKGRYLEYVPRPRNPEARWEIYRKDFEVAVARKERQLSQEYSAWDELFETVAVSLD